ncbi:MAG: response regulator [Candidatus Omnitrophica bacterium]|nr:response regulator [Candidatus Omnitrophota bacterium]MDD5042405.1 response regulator [Candidatus Omnitrophota bacterium]MDD5501104.1 response regulator [Candidatus Omnitrophota bacterium]
MGKKKILIIDDEENFCNLVKKNVERTGEFEVCTATNGDDGVRMIKEIKPDLILLDIVMPGLDGGDVVSMIREDETIKDTPIVFLTSLVRKDEAGAGFTKGYSLLAKTVTLGELISCIKENVRA